MKKPKIFVLVKNFEGINHDVEIYDSFKAAKREFREYAGFRFNMHYTDPHSKKYSEKFSETKIYELGLPGFLELKKGGSSEKKK